MGTALRGLTPFQTSAMVKTCVVKEARKEKTMKITVAIAREEWRFGLIECFKQVPDAEHKAGRPSPSGLEDELSKWLESLQL